MKRGIKAASDTATDPIKEAIDNLSDDFDYIISGLEKLARSGANASQEALAIAENIADDFQTHISSIADIM